MIMSGYISPTHMSLLNPMYAPHFLAPCDLSPWKHPGSLTSNTGQKHPLYDCPLQRPGPRCPSQLLPMGHGCVKTANGCTVHTVLLGDVHTFMPINCLASNRYLEGVLGKKLAGFFQFVERCQLGWKWPIGKGMSQP